MSLTIEQVAAARANELSARIAVACEHIAGSLERIAIACERMAGPPAVEAIPHGIIDNGDPQGLCCGCGKPIGDDGFALFGATDRYNICPACHRSVAFWVERPKLAQRFRCGIPLTIRDAVDAEIVMHNAAQVISGKELPA